MITHVIWSLFLHSCRLAKEVKVYVQETSELEARKAKLVSEGVDSWDVKNAVREPIMF